MPEDELITVFLIDFNRLYTVLDKPNTILNVVFITTEAEDEVPIANLEINFKVPEVAEEDDNKIFIKDLVIVILRFDVPITVFAIIFLVKAVALLEPDIVFLNTLTKTEVILDEENIVFVINLINANEGIVYPNAIFLEDLIIEETGEVVANKTNRRIKFT